MKKTKMKQILKEQLTKIRLDRYLFLGLFVLASLVANQWVNFVRWQDPFEILWFCDMTALILGIGLILKNKGAATLTLVMAIPAQFLWIVDFFLEATGNGMGRTAELWGYGQTVFWFSVNLHAILIPVSFYAVWKLGFEKRILKPVLLYAYFLLTITYLTSEPVTNRNCVFYDCDHSDPGEGYLKYFIFKLLLYWELVFVVSFFVQKKVFSIIETRRKRKTAKEIVIQAK